MLAEPHEINFVLARAQYSRFRWEARGDSYCKPTGPLTDRYDLAVRLRPGVPTTRICSVPRHVPACVHQPSCRGPNERVRVIDADLALDLGLPDEDDFWLIDDEYLVLLRYDQTNELCRGEIISQESRIELYRRHRDLAWKHAADMPGWVDGVGSAAWM